MTNRRRQLSKALKLAGLAVLGLSTVSIPVTIALVLSATGTSDVLTLGEIAPKSQHTTPAKAVAGLRCTPKRGYYALTFEDGPFPTTTPKLVRALEKAKAVATFFDVGSRAAARQDLVELQRGVGQLANHTYTHVRLSAVSEARRVQELQHAARALDYPNAFFRPPYGETDPRVDDDVRRSGLTPVYWTVDAEAAGLTVEAITARALTVQPGGVILLHDGVEASVAAVPGVVEGLRKRGMCPGFLGSSSRLVVGPNGRPFSVVAVKP